MSREAPGSLRTVRRPAATTRVSDNLGNPARKPLSAPSVRLFTGWTCPALQGETPLQLERADPVRRRLYLNLLAGYADQVQKADKQIVDIQIQCNSSHQIIRLTAVHNATGVVQDKP